MTISVQYTSATVRIYSEGKSFKNFDKYDVVATLQFLGDGFVFLSGLHGKLNRLILAELAGYLFGMGVHTLLAERHRTLKSYNVKDFLPI